MQMKLNTVFGLVSPILFALVIATSPSTASNGRGQPPIAADAYRAAESHSSANGVGRSTIRLADAHADACLWNYNNCMKGCDGAASCSNQCKVNYDGCMRQAG
jgi:hypothetical protein